VLNGACGNGNAPLCKKEKVYVYAKKENTTFMQKMKKMVDTPGSV